MKTSGKSHESLGFHCSGLVEISLCTKDHPKKAKLAVDSFLPESTKREISSPPAVNRGNKTALQDGASCYVTLD